MNPNGFHAPNATDGERHEKGSFHHCRQMFRHGLLNGSRFMEQGGAHARIRPYYFSGISFPQKKFQEMDYVSVRVRPGGNQEHPITEVTDSKKAGNIVGGVKDNGASLDC